MNNFDACPSCGASIKSSMFNSNSLLKEEDCELIAITTGKPKKQVCQKCGIDDYSTAVPKLSLKLEQHRVLRENLLKAIPVLTLHLPFNWHYEVKGLVTSRANLGTGIFTDLSTSVSDVFGSQSDTYNNKVKASETACLNILRREAIKLGANAIIGVDIDYSEVGNGKAVLICMAGTAIRVINTEVLGENSLKAIEELSKSEIELADWKTRIPKTLSELGLS